MYLSWHQNNLIRTKTNIYNKSAYNLWRFEISVYQAPGRIQNKHLAAIWRFEVKSLHFREVLIDEVRSGEVSYDMSKWLLLGLEK